MLRHVAAAEVVTTGLLIVLFVSVSLRSDGKK
jgi:hypothetical protein